VTQARHPEISRMTADDLDAVVALEASLQDFPWSRGNFADSLAAGHEMRVLRLGGDVVGFSVVVSIVDEAHLLVIGVDRRHHRHGHGARLLRQIIDTARADGAARLLLEVRPVNTQAIAFYQSFGFAQIGVRRGYYPAVTGREDALVFEMEL
jgi:[ribosomal protein S18]-alanine N-acetyltransferase